ncbi:hypothetical protein, partial [Faecalibaculum rodentium]|uniref:hypothetical protein n=1 Tax=Faecalibaculum rodentium TaxID=1702221 RepID=UPI00272B18B4
VQHRLAPRFSDDRILGGDIRGDVFPFIFRLKLVLSSHFQLYLLLFLTINYEFIRLLRPFLTSFAKPLLLFMNFAKMAPIRASFLRKERSVFSIRFLCIELI